MSWRHAGGDRWLHRPWWKVVINRFLRLFQPQARKWVVYTRTVDGEPGGPPVVVGYGFGRVLHLGDVGAAVGRGR